MQNPRTQQTTSDRPSSGNKLLRLGLALITGLSLIASVLTFSAAPASADDDTSGSEFWLAFPPNYQSSPNLDLFIAGETAGTGLVTVSGISFSAPFSVTPGTVTTVDLPSSAQVNGSDTVQQLGIHVTADVEVSVYGLNQLPYTTDAYLGLPADILGTEYLVMSYQALSSYGSTLTAVATQDSTVLTVTPSETVGARAAGVPYAVSLDQGEVYQLESTGDLTGSVVAADKPVAVFGGVRCANIPVGYYACDHVVEQMFPTSTWGQDFVTMPLATRTKGDTFRILAATDGTEVRIDGALVATLDRSEFHETIVTDPATISASEAVLVAQYSNGTGYDGVTSDPFEMLIPPKEQFLAGYTITTPASGFSTNFVNLVVPDAAVGAVTIDGTAVPVADYTPIGSSGFSGTQVDITLGSHVLDGPLPFGATIYGFASADSYGYPGGLALSEIALVSSLRLEPPTATNPVDVEDCVTATVRDQNDAPLEGIRVDFEVAGANTDSGFDFTNTDGQTEYCYTGTSGGDDTITATVGQLDATATKTWTTNAAPEVSATADTILENGTASIDVTVDDPEGDDVDLTIDWGEGAPQTATVGNGTHTFTHQYLDDNPTNTTSDVYTVAISATDGNSTSNTSTTVTVDNVDPDVDAVAASPVDLNTWTAENQGSANWQVDASGNTVLQTVNGAPTVFYGDFNVFGQEIGGKAKVETTGDDDFFGFVLGFDPGELTAASADFLLIDWKQGNQGAAPRGLAVSRVTGSGGDYWAHTGTVQEIARANTRGSIGWGDNVEYDFDFEYDASRLRVWVNGTLEFDLAAPGGNPFPDGRLGFYNFSQGSVRYTGISVAALLGEEGSPVSVSQDFTDVGTLDTHTGEIAWGDATSSTASVAGSGGAGTVSGNHTYDDNGTYQVAISLTDDDTGTDTEYVDAVIRNVAPTATFTNDGDIDEGQSFIVRFTNQFDPSTADTTAGFQYRYDCEGDGTYGAWTTSDTQACPTSDSGIVSPRGEIKDKDDGSNSYGTRLTVRNVAPTATFNHPGTVAEGTSFELSLTSPSDVSGDMSSLQYRFDCGSGFTVWSSSNTRTCPTTDDGTLAVAGEIRDKDGGSNAYAGEVTVTNAPPTVEAGEDQESNEGDEVDLDPATFTDPGGSDTHTATVNWGDGSATESATVTPAGTASGDGTIYVIDRFRDIVAIDRDTGTRTVISTPTIIQDARMMKLDENTNELVVADSAGRVVLVDISTGAETVLASGLGWVWGVDIEANGDVIAAGNGGVRRIDRSTGANVLLSGYSCDHGVGVATTGDIYVTDTCSDVVERIDPSTGARTLVASGIRDAYDVAFGDDGTIYVVENGGTIKAIDPSTGATSIVASPSGLTSCAYGIAASGSEIYTSNYCRGFIAATDESDGSQEAIRTEPTYGPLGITTADGGRSGEVSGSHVYDDNGVYTVTVCVTDNGDDTACDTFTVTVHNVVPTATFGNDGPVDEGSDFTLELSNPYDRSSADTDEGFQYRFDCGDGAGFGDWQESNTRSCPTSDDDVRTVKGEIKDKDEGVSGYEATVTVDNVAPTVTLTGPGEAIEGDTVTYSFTTTDPGDDSFPDASYDCGANGTVSNDSFDPADGSGSFDCTFPDGPATSSPKVTVTDDDGDVSNTSSVDVTIANEAPTVTLSGPVGVDEDSTAVHTYSFTSTDPGDDTFALVSADCGANGAVAGTPAIDTGTGAGNFDCVFDDGWSTATSTVSVVVEDSDFDDSDPSEVMVEIANVAPTATLGDDGPVDEGSDFTLSMTSPLDPSSADTTAGFTYRFDCGTGSWGPWTTSNTATCPTTDNGVRTVRGGVRDKDGGFTTETGNVTVNNVAPTVTLVGSATSNESETHTYSFTTTDPGADSFPGASYDCGTNGALSNDTYAPADGSGSFDCTFPDGPASSAPNVTITDDDGGVSNTSAVIVAIANVAPTVDAGDDLATTYGDVVTWWGSFDDPGPDSPWTATIDWRDGTVDTATYLSTGTIGGSHAYTELGDHTVEVCVTDEDGDTGCDEFVVAMAELRDRKQAVRDHLASLLPDEPAKSTKSSKSDKDRHRIEKAIEDLDDSLDPELWVDGNHLDPKHGDKVLKEERNAVKDLEKVENIDMTDVIAELVKIDRTLALIEIDEARIQLAESTGDPKYVLKGQKDLADAEEYLAEGDAERDGGDAEKAIYKYRKAWDKAIKAKDREAKAEEKALEDL